MATLTHESAIRQWFFIGFYYYFLNDKQSRRQEKILPRVTAYY